ncbi:MAG: hypothetical protein LBJ96_04330 [Holosporaceae bacterium]|jgi:hypothetical protein|nr:hypothetical protein [Holosporaceae bacterium]
MRVVLLFLPICFSLFLPDKSVCMDRSGFTLCRDRDDQLEGGLVALYKNCVTLVHDLQISLEGCIHPISYWYSEEFGYGIDRLLRNLSPSTQLKMYQELDGYTLAEDCFTADQVRNAIPAGISVKPADEHHLSEWVEFGVGYEVSDEGIPAGGNPNLIPIPPAFRGRGPVGIADDAA